MCHCEFSCVLMWLALLVSPLDIGRIPVEILLQKLFHLLCVKDYHLSQERYKDGFQRGFGSAKRFFERFGGRLDVRGKTVLDFGCGLGSLCIYVAQQGAKKAVGIDIDARYVDFASSKLSNDYQHLSNIVDFRLASDTRDEKFDVIISKDSFEHFVDPERIVVSMKQHLCPDGFVAIGFGPLWKSPFGGHINFMTKLPWAHLLFPEAVIMRERSRFRPNEHAESFEQIRGGLNKMTLEKYVRIIRENGLEFEWIRTNVSDSNLIGLFNLLARVPCWREYFTVNLYSIVRVHTV